MPVKLEFEIKEDIDKFIGKPVLLKYVINNDTEVSVNLPINWKIIELPKILTASFLTYGPGVKIVRVTEISEDKTSNN